MRFNTPGYCFAHVRLLHYLHIYFAVSVMQGYVQMQSIYAHGSVGCALKPKSHCLVEGNQSMGGKGGRRELFSPQKLCNGP